MHQTPIRQQALEALSQVAHSGGCCPDWEDIQRFIDLAARCSVNVLISGGNRRARESLARLIHRESARRDELFIVVDFERASNLRGRLASLGSLFVEETHDLSSSRQAELLGILEQRSVPPVSGRVIAGASLELLNRLSLGTFSADLFYRLNMMHLVM